MEGKWGDNLRNALAPDAVAHPGDDWSGVGGGGVNEGNLWNKKI